MATAPLEAEARRTTARTGVILFRARNLRDRD